MGIGRDFDLLTASRRRDGEAEGSAGHGTP